MQTEAEAKRVHLERHLKERKRKMEDIKKYQVSYGF
jgi:hypothetical protein